MNTWFVASHPIGHHVGSLGTSTESATTDVSRSNADIDGDKTFFMKARIFAGQADLKNNIYGLEEFKWLVKEEIEQHVAPGYWTSIRHMLVQQ